MQEVNGVAGINRVQLTLATSLWQAHPFRRRRRSGFAAPRLDSRSRALVRRRRRAPRRDAHPRTRESRDAEAAAAARAGMTGSVRSGFRRQLTPPPPPPPPRRAACRYTHMEEPGRNCCAVS